MKSQPSLSMRLVVINAHPNIENKKYSLKLVFLVGIFLAHEIKLWLL